MNKDFRVAVSFPHHPKTKKLIRQLGYEAVYSLINLWSFVAMNKPSGVLNNMDIDDIEIASDWNGECSKFVLALLEHKFIDEISGVYSIHDWKDHNGYAFYSPERSKKAKNAAESRWNKKNKNNNLMLNDAKGILQASPSNAPSPDPSPDPSPNKKVFNQKEFEVFYSTYPNRKGKKECLERWKKLLKNNQLPEISVLLTAVKKQTAWRQNANGEFRPEWKYPATWLNKGCWEDEFELKLNNFEPANYQPPIEDILE
ncbi:MAG: hypothetical protein Q7J67_00545 [bacterium]|nr:hypothetical protein [bacterium]